jgi:hypothetical protein
MNKKIILIPQELFNEIGDIASDYDETVDEMAEQLLNAQVTKALQEKATLFYPGRKFEVNLQALIQARMFQSDVIRLHEWLQTNDCIDLLSSHKNEVLIINQSIQKQIIQQEVKQKNE